ncbi:MAG: hypothetical protein V2I56_19365 [Desulfobacteraceae bacterium]|jgi:hypothetical protein|nr:hypothetical protein [Desulfobacteraceae bacterium]
MSAWAKKLMLSHDNLVTALPRYVRLYETSLQKLELVPSRATLHFVGWVELTPSFVGFRCTQSNLHFASATAKCETQQQPISESNTKSFYFD